jgi:predicted Fe-Mo cluster-binding NifX family protein
MKVVVTAFSPELESNIDPRFGRAAYFLSVDLRTMEWEAVPNQAESASGGAGIQAAQFIAEQKASAVISGAFGPNAFRALKAAQVEMYLAGSARTAQEAIDKYKARELECASVPSRPGRSR